MTRILLVDDHQILREGIRKSFEDNGEEIVGEAENGERAVELAKELQPDVVLMDLSMPVLDGVAATKRITEAGVRSKVVMLTMHDDIEKTRQALEAGAVGYLSKGCSFADVLATVRAAADGTVAAITQDTDQVPILVVRHSDGLLTVYANVQNIRVGRGDSVSRGATVAEVGAGDPSFLHFEVRRGFEAVNPSEFLP